MALPQSMKAIRMHQTGGPEVLQLEDKVEVPAVGDNDVLVKIEAAGVNFIDTYHRTGLYKLPLPAVIGREGAGQVLAVGKNVHDKKVGQRVAFFAGGAYAEYASVPNDKAVPIPDGVDVKLAASSMLQGLTAHYLLCSTYTVKAGDTVLIHAGAGGTGGLLIQIAKVKGATVITTVSSEDKAKLVKELGADHVINYTTSDFYEEVKKLTDGKGCEVVYDGVGKSTWEKSLKCLKRRGYLVLFGNASGPVPPVDPLLLTSTGSVCLARPSLVDYVTTAQEMTERSNDLFQWIKSGQVKVRVAKEFPLAEAAAAHEFLTSRNALGKILLLP